MKLTRCCLLLFLVVGFSSRAPAQEKEDPAHEELRTLMKDLIAAHNAGDLDKLVAALDDDAIVTWQNGKVSKGPRQVKAYYKEMTKGPNRVVQKSSIAPVPEDLSILYDGKTACAWGSSKDHYLLTDGTEFDQDTRWSATLVKKKDGTWKAANIHISVNMFDNPILNMAIKKTATWTGGIAGGAGLLVGLLVGAFFFRRLKPAPAA